MNLDEVTQAFVGVPVSIAEAWNVATLWPDRIYATRGPSGAFGLFLRGDAESFGQLPRSRYISHSVDVRIEPAGLVAPMLRVLAPESAVGNRALAYVAHEVVHLLVEDPALSNEHLVRRIVWMLVLLNDDSVALTPERQRGLVGELQLLSRLIRRAQALGRPAIAALELWHGPWPAKRDFSGNGIAVEVKTSADSSRIHFISSLDQLDPQEPSERVFVYSLGVRHDHSAPRKLRHFVADVEVLLDAEEREAFHSRLRSYGFDIDNQNLYDAEPGLLPFHLEPRFFGEDGLVRLRSDSFVGGRPPAPVLTVSYRLLITGDPLAQSLEEPLLNGLLSTPVSR